MTKAFLAAMASAAAFFGAANASTLTFEGFSNTTYGSPIERDGYSIGNVAGDEQHFHEIDSTAFPGFVVSNGTGVLYNDRDSSIFIEHAASSVFNLISFDAAAGSRTGDFSDASTVLTVQGYLGGILTGTILVDLSTTVYVNTFGAALGNIDRLVFSGNGAGGFSLDNINIEVSDVPIPGAALLLLTGLGGIAGLKRRKQKAA